jgi:hypothetical protein
MQSCASFPQLSQLSTEEKMESSNHDHDPNQDRDDVPANDNGKVAPLPSGGALTSLAALSAALASVDTSTVAGRSSMPMIQLKQDDNGTYTWVIGQKRNIVDPDSLWAMNVASFKRGYICFNDNNKVVGERLVSIAQPMPDVTKLPDHGFEWQEQWAVNLKCVSGIDAGTEGVYKPTTVGGIQAVTGSIEAVRDRLNSGQHGGKVSPIVRLEKDSYQHGEHGRVWTPVLTIVDWMALDGPAPAPKPAAPPPAEQPRRRRVA